MSTLRDWGEVRKVLHSLGFAVKVTPYGFDLPAIGPNGYAPDGENHMQPMRLENGSGIAGRGGHWSIACVRSGKRILRAAATPRELKRVLLEWEAGPRPAGGWYPKRHVNRFGASTIWVISPKHGAA